MLAGEVQKKGYLVADFLTLARFLILVYLVFLFRRGHEVFETFILLIFAAWLTDCLDGFFARLSSRSGYLGSYDMWVDWGVYIVSLLYGTTLGHYSRTFFAAFVLLNILAFWWSKSVYVNQAFHFLYIILGFRTVWFESVFWRRFFILWVAGVVFFKRKRLMVQARDFLQGWGHLLQPRKQG